MSKYKNKTICLVSDMECGAEYIMDLDGIEFLEQNEFLKEEEMEI